MPVAKIINGRYSVMLEHDPNDPAKRPPWNPYSSCSIPRERGARYWAVGNMIITIIFLIVKVLDIFIWFGKINIFGLKGYRTIYLESVYCTESRVATCASLVFDFIGQFTIACGSFLFISAALSPAKSYVFRLKLSRYYLFSLLIAIVLFIISKLVVIITDVEYPNYVICSAKVYHKLAIIVWSVGVTLWTHISACNAVSLMFYLERKLEEQEQKEFNLKSESSKANGSLVGGSSKAAVAAEEAVNKIMES